MEGIVVFIERSQERYRLLAIWKYTPGNTAQGIIDALLDWAMAFEAEEDHPCVSRRRRERAQNLKLQSDVMQQVDPSQGKNRQLRQPRP